MAPLQAEALVAEHWPQEPLGSQAGVAPPHSPSPAQARQVCVAVLQIGFVPEHCALVRHGTQVALATSHTGVAPEHFEALVAEHWAQAPLDWQAGMAAGHSASAAQARQVCVAVLQTGAVPLHWAFEVQGTQVALGTSQAGVAPVHWLPLVAEHWAQAPLAWQAGVEPPQSVSEAQARHVCVVVLQTGAVPPHWALEVHGTQVPVGV